jgi:hypothetical protein
VARGPLSAEGLLGYAGRGVWVFVLLAAVGGLLLLLLGPHRRMAPLYADAHVTELLGLLPGLALEARSRGPLTGPEELASRVTSAPMGISYSIAIEGDVEEHHVSISTPRTPARAWGTLFLSLIGWALALPAAPTSCFVSQNHVFHAVYKVPRGSVPPPTARTEVPREALRAASERQPALRARLVEAVLPPA